MDEYFVDFIPLSSVPPSLVDGIRRDMAAAAADGGLEEHFHVYEMQLEFIKDCARGAYFVAAYRGVSYVGGVVLFPDAKSEEVNPPTPAFEGIAKSLYGLQCPVKLNTLLIPAISEFLEKRGFASVHVEPLPRQRKILIEHYGFVVDGEYLSRALSPST